MSSAVPPHTPFEETVFASDPSATTAKPSFWCIKPGRKAKYFEDISSSAGHQLPVGLSAQYTPRGQHPDRWCSFSESGDFLDTAVKSKSLRSADIHDWFCLLRATFRGVVQQGAVVLFR